MGFLTLLTPRNLMFASLLIAVVAFAYLNHRVETLKTENATLEKDVKSHENNRRIRESRPDINARIKRLRQGKF